jgi:hypothetical protein
MNTLMVFVIVVSTFSSMATSETLCRTFCCVYRYRISAITTCHVFLSIVIGDCALVHRSGTMAHVGQAFKSAPYLTCSLPSYAPTFIILCSLPSYAPNLRLVLTVGPMTRKRNWFTYLQYLCLKMWSPSCIHSLGTPPPPSISSICFSHTLHNFPAVGNLWTNLAVGCKIKPLTTLNGSHRVINLVSYVSRLLGTIMHITTLISYF